jgi:hypothetical protein
MPEVKLDPVVWVQHTFPSFKEASDFFEENKEKTDGHIHPNDDMESFVIFTRREN